MTQYFLFGSRKFNTEIKRLVENLKKEGYSINSSINVPFKDVEKPSKSIITNKKYIEEEILNAQTILIYNKEGNIDLLTAMNIEFALIHKKSIILLFDTNDLVLQSLCISLYYDIKIDESLRRFLERDLPNSQDKNEN